MIIIITLLWFCLGIFLFYLVAGIICLIAEQQSYGLTDAQRQVLLAEDAEQKARKAADDAHWEALYQAEKARDDP